MPPLVNLSLTQTPFALRHLRLIISFVPPACWQSPVPCRASLLNYLLSEAVPTFVPRPDGFFGRDAVRLSTYIAVG